ncbi:hypothetical protein Q8W37_05810 [Shimia thalassica]|uniref:hypothetical protein n=1 Tax=Shimia thalassica TaxID=1715693 RepID=UPI0027331E0F|nr:hypothetical protein [Shimia thalassica]MDP2579438.1 hypothetical protein [Shimia thalassica]
MKKLTLEWNAVTTWDDPERQGHASLGKIVQAHQTLFKVGIVTTAASENLMDQNFPKSAADFRERLKSVGWAHLELINTLAITGLTFIGSSRWAPNSGNKELVEKLWDVLPGTIRSSSREFAKENCIPDDCSITSPPYRRWRNAWCDVHSLEAHISARRDVFVTNDRKNFKGPKKAQLLELGVGDICTYDEAWEKYGG